MIRLISAELFKLRKRSMTRVLLFVLIGIMVILHLVLLAISKANLPNVGAHLGNISNVLGLPSALPFAMYILSSFGGVLAIILVASAMGNEYNWRTIRTAVVSSESRFKLLIAKLISAAIFILIGMVIGLAAGFIMSIITTAIGGYKFDFNFMTGSYIWDQFLQLWRTFFIMIPYVLLAFMLAILGRSAMPGIAFGIGTFFIESVFLTDLLYRAGGWVAKIPDYLIYANVQTITSLAKLPAALGGARAGGETITIQLPTPTHAFIMLSIYIIVFIFVAFYFFRKRDVIG